MSTEAVRSWYVSTQRLLELLDEKQLPPQVAQALQSPNSQPSKVVLANLLGPQLLGFLRNEGIHPFHRLAAEGKLTPGVRFAYQGHFYGNGFGAANRTSLVSLSENVSDVLPGMKLVIEFSKSGLVTDTAYSRLSGSTNLFAFCSVTEIDDATIRAVPYVVGDLIERTGSGIDLRLIDSLYLPAQSIDQFSQTDFRWTPTTKQFNLLRNIPERDVKALFCRLLGVKANGSGLALTHSPHVKLTLWRDCPATRPDWSAYDGCNCAAFRRALFNGQPDGEKS